MISKAWTVGEIRTLARQTVEGRQQQLSARGAYFKALVETAQADLGSKADRIEQHAAVRAVHRKFYPAVQESIATDAIIAAAGFARKDIPLERNRRLNFARSSYGTIQRWLRVESHDLMKLDMQKVTKSQLTNESPPTRKQALTPKRVKARAGRLLEGLLGYTRQIAKAEPDQANAIAQDALDQLIKLIARLGIEKKTTTDAKIAAQEMRPLRVGGAVFWPAERIAK